MNDINNDIKNDINVDKLMYALDNENNETIINLTSKKILEINLNILKELHLDKPTTINYLKCYICSLKKFAE